MNSVLSTFVSAFFAVGKRYSLDVKIHHGATSTRIFDIDTTSRDVFLTQYRDQVHPALDALVVHVFTSEHFDPSGSEDAIAEDKRHLEMLTAAKDFAELDRSHEALGNIMSFVNYMNRQ